jgi:hypothetical protein
MHRSSDTIATIAAALAKAQVELTNPEKSLVATDPVPVSARGGPHVPLCSPIERARYHPQEPWPARDRDHPGNKPR